MGGCQCNKGKESEVAVKVEEPIKVLNEPKPVENSKFKAKSKANAIKIIGTSADLASFVNTGEKQPNGAHEGTEIKSKLIRAEGMLYNEESDEEKGGSPRKNNKIFTSNVNENKKDFIERLFSEYNQVRTNPSSFANKIKQHLPFIVYKHGKHYYQTEEEKVYLSNGETCFLQAIDYLNKAEPVSSLEFREELCLKVPENADAHTMNDALKKKTTENLRFNIDITGNCPETSCVLQIVDDTCNKGGRRDNIMNPNFKYVGITVTKGKGRYFNVYSAFSA